MNEQNLSQWFDLAQQNPWEVGVYEAQFAEDKTGFRWFSHWDGKNFNSGWTTIERCIQHSGDFFRDARQPILWRGLSTNPEVKKKPSGNRKVTRHVVIDRGGCIDKPVAVFSRKKLAEEYGSKLFAATVKTIRFRTPE